MRAIPDQLDLKERDPKAWERGLAHVFPQTRVRVDEAFDAGSMTLSRVAEVPRIDVAGSHGSVVHRDGAGAFISFILQREGEAQIEHAGRRGVLSPGQATLLDTERASTLTFAGAHRQTLLLVPRVSLRAARLAPGHVLDAQADPIDGLILAHLARLADADDALEPGAQRAILGSLLHLAPNMSATRRSREDVRRCLRSERAQAFVASRYRDPALNAAGVAAAQGVSRRHLDALLQARGLTLERLIWQARLESAARELRAHPERSVLAVALDNGFRNASHFARRFRRRYGERPSVWRKSAG